MSFSKFNERVSNLLHLALAAPFALAALVTAAHAAVILG